MATATFENENEVKDEAASYETELAAKQNADPNGWKAVPSADFSAHFFVTEKLNAKYPTLGEFADAGENNLADVFDENELKGFKETLREFVELEHCPEAWRPGLRAAFGLEAKAGTPAPATAEPTPVDVIKRLEAELIDARRRLSEYDEAERRCADAERDVEEAKAVLKEAKEIFDGRVADLRKAIRSKETRYALPLDGNPGDPVDVKAPDSAEETPAAEPAKPAVDPEGWRGLPIDALCDESLEHSITETVAKKVSDAGIETLGVLSDGYAKEFPWWKDGRAKGIGATTAEKIGDALNDYANRWRAAAAQPVESEPAPAESLVDQIERVGKERFYPKAVIERTKAELAPGDISTPELLDLIARAGKVTSINPADLSGWHPLVRQRVREWAGAVLAVEAGTAHHASVPERPEVLDKIIGNVAHRNGVHGNGKAK